MFIIVWVRVKWFNQEHYTNIILLNYKKAKVGSGDDNEKIYKKVIIKE